MKIIKRFAISAVIILIIFLLSFMFHWNFPKIIHYISGATLIILLLTIPSTGPFIGLFKSNAEIHKSVVNYELDKGSLEPSSSRATLDDDRFTMVTYFAPFYLVSFISLFFK